MEAGAPALARPDDSWVSLMGSSLQKSVVSSSVVISIVHARERHLSVVILTYCACSMSKLAVASSN